MPQRLVSGQRLCRLLGVSDETMRVWHAEGFLRAALRIQNVRHYTLESIDELLRNNARNFAITPTALDLLAGRITFVNAPKARAALGGISLHILGVRVESGRIAALKLLNEMRYSLESIHDYNDNSSRARNDLVSRKTVTHVLGFSNRVLTDLIHARVLVCESVIENLHLRHITQGSLMALLAELLPPWIDPQDWMDDRLLSDAPLVTVSLAKQMLQVNAHDFERLVEERKFHYILTPSHAGRRFSPESLGIYLDSLPIVTREDFGVQFGVTREAVSAWFRQGVLTCSLPGHKHGEEWDFKQPCLLGILRRCLSPKISVNAWCKMRTEGGGQLLVAYKAAAMLGLRVKELMDVVEAGELSGLCSPTGAWQFTERQVVRVRQRRNKKV